MNRLLSRLRKSRITKDAPAPVDALEQYKDELDTQWQEFVHKARVHEMLKCLQHEHKKLQILRENIDFDEFIADVDGPAPGEDEAKVLYKNNAGGPEDENGEGQKRSSGKSEKSFSNSLGKAKTAIAMEMFKSADVISDKEFEEILELCDDKMEQQALRDAFEEKKNRDKYLRNASERRQMLYDFINSKFFVKFMLIVIFVSIVGICLLTFESISTPYSYPLMVMDSCIIAIFVVEATFKIIIYKLDYFKSVWNLLDILIIVVHLLEVTVELITKTLALSAEVSTYWWFRLLKSLRALRLLRVIKFLPNLQVVLLTVFQSMLSMGSIAVLMILFIFVFAVMGRGLFFENSPIHFGSIWLAFVTLFQLLTLDDWFELLDNVKAPENGDGENIVSQYWLMFIYLFFYIVIEYFVFLNLFVAVLVDNFQLTLADAEVRKKRDEQLFLEEQQKFEEIDEIDITDPGIKKSSLTDEMDNELELGVDDYYPVQKDSKESQILSDIFKDMNSLDFERFLWKRRLTLLNMTVDQALDTQRNSWTIQDAENVSRSRFSSELEHKEDDDDDEDNNEVDKDNKRD